ncbi:MAG: alpha/beta fold hydrolase, partial [Flammeovirgaceae bacterium]
TAPTLLDYAADLHETLEELGIRKHTLIGHSLGGYVALAYAQNHADCLAGLGLFHSTAFADPEPKKETRTKSIDFIKQYGAATFIQNMFGGLFSPSKKEALKAEIASFIKRCCKTEAESIMKTQLAMRDRDEGISVINTLEVPILFIVGKDDQSVSLAQSMEQASMPKDAVVHILEDVAHMGMIEAPQQTLKAVEGFLRYCGE